MSETYNQKPHEEIALLRLKVSQLEQELETYKHAQNTGSNIQLPNLDLDTASEDLVQLLNLTNDIFAILGFDGIIRKVTPTIEKITGYTQSELQSRSFDYWIHPEDKLRAKQEIIKLKQGKEVLNFEFRFLHHDGYYKWLAAKARPVLQDKIVYCVIHDISNNRDNEEGRLRFQAKLLEQVNDAVIVIDENNKILYFNRAAENLYQVRTDDVLGRSVREIYELEWARPEDEVNLYNSLNETGYWRGEVIQYKKATGERLYIEATATSIRDANGLYKGRIGVSRDITERKKTEEVQQYLAKVSVILSATLDYEETLRNVVNITVPYLADWFSLDLNEEAIGREGTIRRVATAHVNPEKEALAKNLLELYPYTPQQLAAIKEALRPGQIMFNAEVKESDLKSISRSPAHFDALRHMNLSSSMLVPLIARGELLGAFTLGITESDRRYTEADKLLAERLSRRVAMAIDNALLYREAQIAIARQVELDQLKDQFISIAGHELRTPLTAIKGYAQLLTRKLLQREQELLAFQDKQTDRVDEDNNLLSDPKTSSDGENPVCNKKVTVADTNFTYSKELQLLSSISHQSNRLNSLIDEMLDTSRIQTGQLALNYTPDQDIVRVIEEVIERHQSIDSEHIVSLQAEVRPILVSFDTARIEQVLTNLIGNAAKYSPDNSPITLSVFLIEKVPNEVLKLAQPEILPDQINRRYIKVCVADQGMGISSDQQPYLFERFYRVRDNSIVKVEGLGLGLYISKQIIVQHGGRIWVESEKNVGSTFCFILPVSPNLT